MGKGPFSRRFGRKVPPQPRPTPGARLLASSGRLHYRRPPCVAHLVVALRRRHATCSSIFRAIRRLLGLLPAQDPMADAAAEHRPTHPTAAVARQPDVDVDVEAARANLEEEIDWNEVPSDHDDDLDLARLADSSNPDRLRERDVEPGHDSDVNNEKDNDNENGNTNGNTDDNENTKKNRVTSGEIRNAKETKGRGQNERPSAARHTNERPVQADPQLSSARASNGCVSSPALATDEVEQPPKDTRASVQHPSARHPSADESRVGDDKRWLERGDLHRREEVPRASASPAANRADAPPSQNPYASTPQSSANNQGKQFSWNNRKKKKQKGANPHHKSCDLCGIFVTGQAAWDSHIRGKKHKDKERQAKYQDRNSNLSAHARSIAVKERARVAGRRVAEEASATLANGHAPRASSTPAAAGPSYIQPRPAASNAEGAPRPHSRNEGPTNGSSRPISVPASSGAVMRPREDARTLLAPKEGSREPPTEASDQHAARRVEQAPKGPPRGERGERSAALVRESSKTPVKDTVTPSPAAPTSPPLHRRVIPHTGGTPPLPRLAPPSPSGQTNTEPGGKELVADPSAVVKPSNAPQSPSTGAPSGLRSMPAGPGGATGPSGVTGAVTGPGVAPGPPMLRSQAVPAGAAELSSRNDKKRPRPGSPPTTGGARQRINLLRPTSGVDATPSTRADRVSRFESVKGDHQRRRLEASAKPSQAAPQPVRMLPLPVIPKGEERYIPKAWLDGEMQDFEWMEFRDKVFQNGTDVGKLAFKLLQEMLLSPTLGINLANLAPLSRVLVASLSKQLFISPEYPVRVKFKDFPEALRQIDPGYASRAPEELDWDRGQSAEHIALCQTRDNLTFAFQPREDLAPAQAALNANCGVRGRIPGVNYGKEKRLEDAPNPPRYMDAADEDPLYQQLITWRKVTDLEQQSR